MTEQGLPTPAELMAQAIYAQCVCEELRAAGGNTDPKQLDAAWLVYLREFARRAARVYFESDL